MGTRSRAVLSGYLERHAHETTVMTDLVSLEVSPLENDDRAYHFSRGTPFSH